MTANGAVEAQLVRGLLESAGVPVVLERRDVGPGSWLYLVGGNPHAPVHVFVPASLLDAARLEVLEAGFAVADQDAARVPEPPAPQRPAPQRGHRWSLMVLGALVIIAVLWIILVQIFGSATCMLRVFCG
jgi:hypothetical protein